jgi:2,3-diketo-5-methylthio-1-phosphopentane phosphatase
MPRTAIIFDYDWSLINTNSDTWVFEQMFHNENPRVLLDLALGCDDGEDGDGNGCGEGMQWTKAVDQALQIVQKCNTRSNMNVTSDSSNSNMSQSQGEDAAVTMSVLEQIYQVVANVPVQEGMLDAVRFAANQPNVELHIVSDANTIFIDKFLDKHDLSSLFAGKVISNYGIVEDEENEENENDNVDGDGDGDTGHNNIVKRLRVRPYHNFDTDPPHGCELCPPNMCKGNILTNVLHIHDRYDRVVYIGDGEGDFCPCTKLKSPQCLVLARKDDVHPARKEYGLVKCIDRSRNAPHTLIQAKVQHWSTGHDIHRIFREYLASDGIMK